MSLSAFFPIASLALWAAAFLYFRSYLKRRTGAERILAEFREEVEKLVAEIDAATDRDAMLVEERVKALRSLLEDADRRIAAYKRELNRRSAEEQAYAELGRRAGKVSPQAQVSVTIPRDATEDREFSSVGGTRSDEVSAPRSLKDHIPRKPVQADSGGPSEGAPRFVRSATPVEPKGAPFAERVVELYRAGFSADIIANRLGSTVAEVDLAIALSARMEGDHGDDSGH